MSAGQITRGAVVGVLIGLLLAGCGAGSNFADTYEAEKARIRSVVPSSIECEERSATVMACTNGDPFLIRLQDTGSGLTVMLGITYDIDPGLLRNVLAMYGLSQTEIDKCRESGSLSGSNSKLSYSCNAGYDNSKQQSFLNMTFEQRRTF